MAACIRLADNTQLAIKMIKTELMNSEAFESCRQEVCYFDEGGMLL